MADVERSVTIARGPEAVRAFLLDGDSVMRWQPRLEEYEHLPPDRLEVGTRTRGVVVARGRRLEWTAEIVEWDEAGWKWRSLAANPRWQMRWDLEAVAGGTVLTYRQWSPALSHIAAIAWRNRLGRRAERDLERLRLMLEDEDEDEDEHLDLHGPVGSSSSGRRKGAAVADIELQVTIASTPERVRELIMDPERATSWQGSLTAYEQTTPGPAGPGTQSKGTTSLLGQSMDWTAEIVEWDEGGWTWKSVVADPPWELRWEVEGVEGGTRVTFRKSSPALSGAGGLLARKFVGAQDEKDLQALRGLLEGA